MSGGGGGGVPMGGTGGGSRVPQPGYERMTDYSMGFGRIAPQPSFLNPFMGAYGFGQPFGGFGGGFGSPYGRYSSPFDNMYGGGYDPFGGYGGGFGGYGGGYQSGIGGLFGGYGPSPFGGYGNPGNAYARPPRPVRDPDLVYALPMPNPNPVGLQGGGLNDPNIVYDSLGQPGYRNRELTREEIEAGRAAVRSGSPIAF